MININISSPCKNIQIPNGISELELPSIELSNFLPLDVLAFLKLATIKYKTIGISHTDNIAMMKGGLVVICVQLSKEILFIAPIVVFMVSFMSFLD